MMPAVKHFDPIMGVDIHILIIPMVGPVPIPHPHIAMVLDPMDFIPVMGATVMVGVMRRGTAGTAGKSIPHIPMGAPFAKPPMNESEIFMGSAMVLADGSPMTFTALPVLTCHDIGMIAPPRKKPKKTYGMMMPTSMVMAIPAGLPVLVGGPPTIDMMGVAMAGGMKAMGAAMGKLRKLQKSSKKMKKVSDAIHDKAKKAMNKLGVPPKAQNKVHKGICSITGHPVDVAAGKLFTEAVDFELPGPLPIKWERTWFSTSEYDGPLGHGWHHNYDVALRLGEKALAVRMADGRPVGFPLLEVGEAAFQRAERLTLIRDSRGYAMDTADGLRYRFFPQTVANGNYLLQSLTEKTTGSTIKFAYSSKAELIEITDSVGRFIRFENDAQGRIKKIFLPTPEADSVDNVFCAFEYFYERGELVAAADALKQKTLYRYENHLLMQETLKNGLNFYFKFDGKDPTARCIETWGDGEIYYRKLEYDTENNITKVFDSEGYLTVYHHDGSLPHQIVNPKGYVSYIEYNDYSQIIAEIDEVGGKTQYEYDDFGNIVKQVLPGAATYEYKYDLNQNLIEAVDCVGGKWQYEYDNQNRLILETDPLRRKTQYQYSDVALVRIVDSAGGQYNILYDRYGNIRNIEDPLGNSTQWEFDQLGNVICVIDPNGNRREFQHNRLNRVVAVREPDGNLRQLHYDAMGNVSHVKDQQLEVEFQYSGLGRMTLRKQAGASVKFEYDKEERLLAIANENSRVYKFKYDELGALVSESGFDGLMREYYRDPMGRVSRIQRPGGRFSEYAYDEAGNIGAIKHNDGFVEHFTYRSDGLLTSAKNPFVHLQFERNVLGLIIKESHNDYWITSEYDDLDNRVALQSSFGINQTVERNLLGEVKSISWQEDQYRVDYSRDQLGLELQRILPGGITSRWQRDKLGRPIKQEILQGKNSFGAKTYVWGVNNRLQKIIDQLGRETVFKHDLVGNLVSAQYADGGLELRMPDAVGNLFKTESQKDRDYGPAGQLLAVHEKNGTTRFDYDPEGNLIRKTQADGKVWQYRWNGVGMLSKVIRPDGNEVEFHYDPLGRRIAKKYKNKVTRWVWDGHNPLHEWVERGATTHQPVILTTGMNDEAQAKHRDAVLQPSLAQGPPEEGSEESPITWLYEPDSLIPMAKLVGDQFYSIVTDFLGTPTAMFDQAGNTVWSGELNIWGQQKNVQGNSAHCPFRWQGQYEDVETGLYYNRFRYFDPKMGEYISQDPIRVSGGIQLYAYVKDPNIYIDPYGLSESCGADVGAWKGPADYSKVKDPKNLINTKPTPRQVREMKKINMEHNGGVLRSDLDGTVMVDSKKSKKGVTPPTNEAQVDHIVPVAQGGTRNNSNLQLLTRQQNRDKWDT